MVFAEHRRWPHNPDIQAKALVYAGIVAHYAGDLCQPLHTTIHHNGRANPDGSSPGTGLHHQVDVLFEREGFDRAKAIDGIELEAYEDLMAAVSRQFDDSHALVEVVYDLEPLLPERADQKSPLPPAVRAFTSQTVPYGGAFYSQPVLDRLGDVGRGRASRLADPRQSIASCYELLP